MRANQIAWAGTKISFMRCNCESDLNPKFEYKQYSCCRENRARILEATEMALQKIESYQNKEGEVKLNIKSSKSNFTLWCNLTPGNYVFKRTSQLSICCVI